MWGAGSTPRSITAWKREVIKVPHINQKNIMEYTKCDNHPRCTFTECECYQKKLFEKLSKGSKNIQSTMLNQKIIKYEIVDDVPNPIFEK